MIINIILLFSPSFSFQVVYAVSYYTLNERFKNLLTFGSPQENKSQKIVSIVCNSFSLKPLK